MYIDVHCHLDDESFDEDREEIIKECEKEEIIVINAGQEHKSNLKVLEIAESWNNMHACLGMHPEFIENFSDEDIENEIKFIKENKEKIVGISEIGLDYFWVKDSFQRERQKVLFRKMLELARELDLPVVVHSRGAYSDVLKILEEFRDLKIVLHSFSGSQSQVRKAIEMGCFFSISCSVCYAKQKQELVRLVPIEKILSETDSPVMSPIPKKRNVPMNVKIAVRKIAEIKGIDENEINKKIVENAKKVFELTFK